MKFDKTSYIKIIAYKIITFYISIMINFAKKIKEKNSLNVISLSVI